MLIQGDRFPWRAWYIAAFLIAVSSGHTLGQDAPGEIDAEISRQQAVAERFLTVLEKNPRRGTSLDRVYGFHVENGTVETFVGRFQQRVKADPKDGAAWMVLGLIESQRGKDADAAVAFTQAVDVRPTDPLAPYYLGQSLLLTGQPDKAAAALEKAIARKPSQTDLLEIFQALGRIHQRAQRSEDALAVWTRLERLFPNDPRVQEQIAVTMVEEGQVPLALPRYEALIKITKDEYRKSVYTIEAAELKVKLNRSTEAVGDLETLLATLNPTSWLHREVRRKIEEVYLRTDDQDGLAKYYERWIGKHPEDVDAMARLARVLARQARVREAQSWLDKALKLAPSRKELRRAFIEQLVDDQRFADAVVQYALLDKAEPNNPDTLREWGKLILRDTARTKAARRVEAEKVWRRLLAARPNDPLIATQVADLFRHCDMQEPALELYQKAVSLAPEQPQYREYLGEFYHQLKRPEEAVATWRQLAAGKLRTASNVARLAEVLASYGYLELAVPEIQAACKLDPKDFSLQIKAAELLSKAQKYADADAALSAAQELVQNDDEAELVLAAQLSLYQTDGSLAKRTSDLAAAVTMPNGTAQQLYLLTRYYEAQRQYADATTAIVEALKTAPRSVPMLSAAARVRQQAGDLKAAANTYRQLSLADRRGRSEYLKQVAQIETQLGRIDAALATGKELIASAPGNTENYEFYADMCFRLGKSDEGLDTLRRAVRVNPNETGLALKLAASLAEQFRTDEAIELYWQAFDKEAGLDGKLAIIPKLAELYLQINHLDRLMERLERQRRDADDKREMTISLAQAYHSAGDYGMARQELEGLLSESTRDTQLLQQLGKLAESEGDLTDAIKYQVRLAKLAPGPETEYRLATLLSQNGAQQESAAILVRLATREEDFEKVLRNIDSLLANDQASTALQVIQSKLREEPQNWELLYREGVALTKTPVEARTRFEAILALAVAEDALGIAAKNAAIKAAKSKNPATASQALARRTHRLESAYQARIAAGLSSPDYYGVARPALWAPRDFSQARLGSIAWLIRLAQDEGSEQLKALTDRFRKPSEAVDAPATALWDWASFLTVQTDTSENRGRVREVMRRLAQQKDISAQQQFLTYLRPGVVAMNAQGGAAKLPPLSDEDLELALECYKALGKNPNAYAMNNASIVMKELERAGRKQEADELYDEFISEARDADQLTRALMLNVQRAQTKSALELFHRWSQVTLQETRPATNYSASMPNFLCELIGLSNAAKDDAAVLSVLDAYLDHNRQRANKQRQRPPARATASMNRSNYYVIYIGKNRQSTNFAYPQPNDYFDTGALQLLRNAYESFRQRDLLSDLEQHVAKRVANANAADKVYEHLVLGYLLWWNENTEGAIEQLTAASRLAPHDIQLQLELADFQTQLENFDAALALVDLVAPTTQELLRKKETLALNLAVRLGDHERAKQSAERLFGLRLDAETQVQLAAQLRRLGMTEQAEAVLMRAQRQSGNRLAGQVALMSFYQSSGKTDIAAQIASQILRRSRSAAPPAGSRRMGGSDDSARVSALQVMNAAGKLKSMIVDAEQQLTRSPEATQIYHALIEYYQASGNSHKALEWQGKLVELRSDDPAMRVAYAQQLAAAGKFDDACLQYTTAIKAQPRLIQGQLESVFNAYRQANKPDELMELLGTIDLRQFGQYHQVFDIVATLMRDKKQRPLGIVMLKRAWDAFPDQRAYLVSSMYDDELWDVKEIYDFGKQALLPDAAAVERDPWHGIGQVRSYSGDGVVNTSIRSILRTAAKTNQLPALRDEILAAAKQHPDWKAGPLLAAIVDANLGNHVDVLRQKVEDALAAEPPMPFTARWVIGLELEQHKSLNDLIVKMYEGALAARDGSSISNQYQYSPAPRLVKLYVDAGKKDAARVLLAKAEEEKYSDYDPSYAEVQRVENWISLARQYEQLDFPLDALRLYRKSLTNLATFTGNPYGNSAYYSSEAQRQLDALTQKLLADEDAAVIPELLRAGGDKDNSSSIDLMLGMKSTSTGIPKFNSQLFDLLTAAKEDSQTRTDISHAINGLAASHGEDLNVAILSAAWALHVNDASSVTPRVHHLVALVEKQPLEALPAGQRPNSRQRAEALRHVGLWLAARGCLTSPGLRKEGQWLADKALEGAKRQVDSSHAVALLVEAAQRSIASNNKEAAAKELNLLIEIALARPKSKAAATHIPPVTLTQFRHGLLAARLAAELGLADLSLSAARESLRGGLPVPDTKQTVSRGGLSSVRVFDASEDRDERLLDTFGNELRSLSQVWRAKQLPATEMYDLLHDIVFPANRPDEILLYERAITDWSRPQSVGLELVRWSSEGKRQPQLLKALEERGQKPAARLPALVLKTLSAVESKDQASAQAALRELQKPQQASQARGALALHAAALAFQTSELKADALPLLVATFKGSGQNGSSAGAVTLVGKYFAQQRQTNELRELYNEYLLSRQRLYVQQDSDYSNYVLSNDLNQILQTIGMAGDVRLTLEYMARAQDLPDSRYGNHISHAVPLYHLAWQLSAVKPAERYQLLRAWTMPDKSRRTLRFVAGYSSGDQTPMVFVPPHLAAFGPAPAIGLLDNFTMLVAAAREAGQLDDLQEAVAETVADDLPYARLLAALVAIGRDDAQAPPAIEKLIAEARERMKSPAPSGQAGARNVNAERWSDVILVNAALAYRPTRFVGQKFADAVLQDNRNSFHLERATHVARAIALDALRDLPAPGQQSLLLPGLKLWSPSSPPGHTSGSQPPAWWAANGKYISHVTGFEYDSLYFKYPLEGTFEFSFEAHGYDFSQGEVAYGGLISIPEFWNQRVNIMPVSRHETLDRNASVEARDWWNRYSVQVSPKAIRFFSNGHLVYEEADPSPTSPWLHLVSLDHRRTAFRNLRLTGAPRIPRTVPLSHGNRLDGWRTPLGDALPKRLTANLTVAPSTDEFGNELPAQNAATPHWTSQDAVIHGRYDSDATTGAQACLSYHRPLQPGESVSYEFFYEPGKTHVHPALGRLVFLLEPAGIRTHWLTMSVGPANPIDLEPQNAIEAVDFRRDPAELPLKPGEWNSLQVSLVGDVAVCQLNGQKVMERPLETNNTRSIGLFHYRDQTAAQVRNIVLTGNWPERLADQDRQNLAALQIADESPESRRARHALVREVEQADEAVEVWQQAQSLSPQERYDYLKDWVLPSSSHPTIRLHAHFVPVDQPAPAIAAALSQLKGARRHVGGHPVSPACELVRVATTLKKLDEVRSALEEAGGVPDAARSLCAFEVLLAVAQEDDVAAKAALAKVLEGLKALPGDTLPTGRFPEFTAVLAALERPSLYDSALPVAELLVENQHSNYQTLDWERLVRWLRAKARWHADALTTQLAFGETSQTPPQWQAVSHPTAEQRGRGLPPATWRITPGKASFHTGQGGDSLYFQSPLAGDFEVRCKRTTFGWKEIRLQYASAAIDVHNDGQSIWHNLLARGGTQHMLDAKIPKWGEQVDYRLVVKDRTYTVYVNDKEVHREVLGPHADPWLTIQTNAPHFNGQVEDLQIVGTPTVPEVLHLSEADQLHSWRADYYGESIDTDDAQWQKKNGEIVGALFANAAGSQRESVLQYHRPLLEDGKLSYEFYYEPGKYEVHPALDRAALLVSPTGVKVHYLTDGAYNRTSVTADNATPLAGVSDKPPLKTKDWNTLEMQLVGDLVTLTLNRQKIAEYQVEVTNQRIFGLFRYSDATSARVRNVTYRGEWPQTIPSLQQQFLRQQ